MDLTEKILKLTTLALGLRGKTIRLQGVELGLGVCMVVADGGPNGNLAAMRVEWVLAEDGPQSKPDCACAVCETGNVLAEPKLAFTVTSLLSNGRAEKLVLDSCAYSDGRFTAKVRNTASRRCDVGEGKSMILAVAHATAKASRE